MILDDIVAKKKIALSKGGYKFDIKNVYNAVEKNKTASFYDTMAKDGLSIIGEVKKASPSRGIIKENFNPVEIAKEYEGSVDAVSVLTEEDYFMGSPAYLRDIHKEVSLPLLRKDFIISPLQVLEAGELGASAVLLIVAVLKESCILREYIQLTKGLGMDALVEVHNKEELETALSAGADIVGINNRNLLDFSEDIFTTVRLSEEVPKGVLVISESSIHTPEDIKILKSAKVNGILVGESFMRSGDITKKAKEFKDAYGD